MIHYDENVAVVMETLSRFNYRPPNIYFNQQCFARLRCDFNNDDVFSPEKALNWCDEIFTGKYYNRFKLIVQRLIDVYGYGYVLPVHLRIYGSPSDSFRMNVDSYVETLSHTAGTLCLIKNACRHFCCFAQCNGAFSIDKVNYQILDDYYKFIMLSGSYSDYLNYNSSFLHFLAGEGLCSYGYSLALKRDYRDKCISFCNFSSEQKSKIIECTDYTRSLSANDFFNSIPGFVNSLKPFGYSENYLSYSAYYLKLFSLFLDRFKLGYNRGTADIWISESINQSALSKNRFRFMRRAFDLYDDYIAVGCPDPDHMMRNMPSSYKTLPLWCTTVIDKYVAVKRKEGRSEGSIRGIITDTSKFCAYVVSRGICSFGELNPDDVKSFNLQNGHLAHSTKKNRNSNIRSFLIYMEMNHIVTDGLHFSIPCNTASGEKIVKVLSFDDIAKINSYCGNASTVIELRDAAILQIGMSTALRASDILSLRISDIDWKNRFINIIQGKTKVEHHHPTDVKTLNAVFRYLRDGRHKGSGNDFIFVSTKAPYSPLTNSACNDALKRSGASVTDFHRLRRTYATDSLNNGATISETAELLGHSNIKSVHKYTSLDEEKMRLCPLSLTETGLLLDGRYSNE